MKISWIIFSVSFVLGNRLDKRPNSNLPGNRFKGRSLTAKVGNEITSSSHHWQFPLPLNELEGQLKLKCIVYEYRLQSFSYIRVRRNPIPRYNSCPHME